MAFTDNFTDTDGVYLGAHTPSGGTAWTKVVNGECRLQIYSNALSARNTGTNSVSTYICDDVGSADHYVQLKDIGAFQNSRTGVDSVRLCARLVDATNHIFWYLGGTGSVGSRLAKVVSGSVTDLVTVQGADEDVIKVECDGTNIKFYINGVQKGTTQTVSDHQTETSTGLLVATAQGDFALYDDFEAEALAAGGAVEVSTTLDELTLTEYAAGVNKAVSFTAGLDELAITEYAADVNIDVAVSAGVDALTLTEYNPTVNKEISLTAGIDALVITEYNPTANIGIVVAATVDDLTLTEYNANINAETSIQASIDPLILTALAANVNAETNVSASLDTLTLTEYAAGVTLGANIDISASIDTLTLTEYDTTITIDQNILAILDVLILTEYNAIVSTGIFTTGALDVSAVVLNDYNVSAEILNDYNVSAEILNDYDIAIKVK